MGLTGLFYCPSRARSQADDSKGLRLKESVLREVAAEEQRIVDEQTRQRSEQALERQRKAEGRMRQINELRLRVGNALWSQVRQIMGPLRWAP